VKGKPIKKTVRKNEFSKTKGVKKKIFMKGKGGRVRFPKEEHGRWSNSVTGLP